ncbi:MAG: alkaline phosphatase family protein [Bryobacteraceae bacterium]
MRKALIFLLLGAGLLAAAAKPKLVVTIVIDQFRYDYLTRYRHEYHAGFDTLLTKGAVFTNAQYEHFPTVTAIGHATILSGATPSISGIIGNDWFDREEGRKVTSVSDRHTSLLGGDPAAAGSSPRRLLVDTLGDELKMAGQGKPEGAPRVIGISLKDRAAILPAGHMADAAYWFDTKSGRIVSSNYYFADLPDWVKDFNSVKPADQYAGANWLNHVLNTDLKKLYSDLEASPFGNELVEALAERALTAEQLGQRGVTDLLTVSFSSNDFVGHDLGPDSEEVHEMCLRTDVLLARFLRAVDGAVGEDNALVVVTADHGVAPMPEVNTARRMPGGRMEPGVTSKVVQAALVKKFGEGQWILNDSEATLYFDRELIARKNLDRAEVERTAAAAALTIPHVFRVYTREQLLTGAVARDRVSERVMNGYNGQRGGDLEVLLDPYWIYPKTGTSHGTTFSYDAHVPLIFLGAGIKAGRYDETVVINDVAPTLATMLDVETPAGSVGRVLSEMFQQ